jgi:GNAT superfamily N-acetyltransferase
MIEYRGACTNDVDEIRVLITNVATEVYGILISDIPSTITSDLLLADSMLAIEASKVIGVGLSLGHMIDDLWLLPLARGRGIGAELLRRLEQEIADQGNRIGKLRVVAANHDARLFYSKQGWQEERQYNHEKLGVLMVEYTKDLHSK